MIKNLKKLRKEKGYSQQHLARNIGVSQQSINKYENHNIEPDIQTLINIARYLETSIDYLVGRTDINRPTGVYEQEDLTEEEKQLINTFRSLDAKNRSCVTAIAETLANSLKKRADN